MKKELNIVKKIPEGYKQTEIGVIPEDWDVIPLEHVANIQGGYAFSSEKFVADGKYQIIKMSNLYGGKLDLNRSVSFLNEINRNEQNYLIKSDDILITLTGTVGKRDYGYTYRIRGETNLLLNQRVARIIPNKKTISIYLEFQFKTKYFFNQFFNISKGGTGNQANAGTSDIEKILIPIPRISEQKAIANVLSDTDTLIEHLGKLIAKKKAIKQGTMQQLLTGKKRLPGYSGKWVVKRVGEVVSRITTGKLDANAMIENGEYRFYTCAKYYYFIDKYAFDTEALLVSGNGANVGYIHYYKGKFNAYQRTYVLSDFSENILFIKLFLERNLQERIRVEVNAGNTPYITMDTISEMSIKFPPTKQEQFAIANIFSDMDAEIEKLEQKRDKYIMLKQGMMQQLLTGRIRIYANN